MIGTGFVRYYKTQRCKVAKGKNIALVSRRNN